MWIEGSISEHREIKSFDVVDTVKFIGAFFMIIGHTDPVIGISKIGNYVLVRFFAETFLRFYFVMSGFLLFRGVREETPELHRPLKYTSKILKIYLIWTLIYLPIICYTVSINEGGILAGILDQLVHFLFVGSAMQFWYLNSLIWSVPLIVLLLYLRADKYLILAVSAVFCAFGLVGSGNYLFSLFLPNGSTAGTLFMKVLNFRYLPYRALTKGFFYISLGMIFAWCRIDIPRKKAYLLLALSAALLAAELMADYYIGHHTASGYYFFAFPLTFMLCYILLKTEIPHKAKYTWYRNMSSMIFYVHVLVLKFLQKAAEFAEAKSGLSLNNGLFFFIATSVLSYILSAVVLKLSEKEKYSFLKILYTGTGKNRRKVNV